MLNLDAHLQAGLTALNITASPLQQEQLLAYLDLLQKWNKTYNLTAVREPQEMLVRHLFDSLAILPYVEPTNLLDIGSGAGLPSIPLAIMRPELKVLSLDSNGKKTRFQFQAKTELNLENFAVTQTRVENLKIDFPVAQIVSRAFASLQDFVSLSRTLANEQTRWLAMKGVYPQQELQDLDSSFSCLASYEIKVPDLNEARHLLVLASNKDK